MKQMSADIWEKRESNPWAAGQAFIIHLLILRPSLSPSLSFQTSLSPVSHVQKAFCLSRSLVLQSKLFMIKDDHDDWFFFQDPLSVRCHLYERILNLISQAISTKELKMTLPENKDLELLLKSQRLSSDSASHAYQISLWTRVHTD